MTFARIIDIASSWASFHPPASLPPGLKMFVAGPTDEGVRIIEMWASRDAWERGHEAFDISGHPSGQCYARELDAELAIPELPDAASDPTNVERGPRGR